MGRPSTPFEDRFWQKVSRGRPEDCWGWTGARNIGGYGIMIKFGSKMVQAHRASYEMHCGPIAEGRVVRHKCDNRICVNPSHLELGTIADNRKDCAERGRAGGSQRKLTDEQVREIRQSTETCRACAARYGVSGALISKIRTGKDRRFTF